LRRLLSADHDDRAAIGPKRRISRDLSKGRGLRGHDELNPCYGITDRITELRDLRWHRLARPFVKSAELFLAARAANVFHWSFPATVFEPRPFLRLMAASASRIAPDTHQDQASAQRVRAQSASRRAPSVQPPVLHIGVSM